MNSTFPAARASSGAGTVASSSLPSFLVVRACVVRSVRRPLWRARSARRPRDRHDDRRAPTPRAAGRAGVARGGGWSRRRRAGPRRGARPRCAPWWAPASWTRRVASRSMRRGTCSSPTPGTAGWSWCRSRAGTRLRAAPAARSRRHARRGQCSGAGGIGHPTGVAVDARGDVYIAEATAQRVQVVRPTGPRTAVTVAGTGQAGFNGDGLAATASELDEPTRRGGRRAGDLFIADTANCRVRRARGRERRRLFGQAMTAGHLYTVAGTGVCGTAGQGGPVAAAQLWDPVAVAVDSARRPGGGRRRRPVRAAGARARRDLLRHRRSARATSASSWAGRAATSRISKTGSRPRWAWPRSSTIPAGLAVRPDRRAVRHRRPHAGHQGGALDHRGAVRADHEGGRPLQRGRCPPGRRPPRASGTARAGCSPGWGHRSASRCRRRAPSTTATAVSTRYG